MTPLPTIHIWSDIACPFCLIGKKRLFDVLPENARIEWHSFILQPQQVTDPSISLATFLARSKGWSAEQTAQIQAQVTDMAAQDGIVMRMEHTVPANTTQAHRLLQVHKNHPSIHRLVELLFKAYFEEGRNIDDTNVLHDIHIAAGGSPAMWEQRLHPDADKNLQQDLQLATQMGIRGVPFFYFEDRFTISGAREPEVFRQAIAQLIGDQDSK